jgi:hypothetical protein
MVDTGLNRLGLGAEAIAEGMLGVLNILTLTRGSPTCWKMA